LSEANTPIANAAFQLIQERKKPTRFYTNKRNQGESQKHRKIFHPDVRAAIDYVYWLSAKPGFACTDGLAIFEGMFEAKIMETIKVIVSGVADASIYFPKKQKEQFRFTLCEDIVSAMRRKEHEHCEAVIQSWLV